LIAHACISSPFGISRDVMLHCYGNDCLYENGSIVVLGKSIDSFEGIEIPKCTGFLNDRAILNFHAVVTPTSPTSSHVCNIIYTIL
jgi:hypothetical protein